MSTASIYYEEEGGIRLPFDPETVARTVIEEALEYEGCPFEAEVNLLLTTDEEIHAMNREFRQIDAPTDVLSFPMLEYPAPSDFSQAEEGYEDCFNPETGELMLGDIILSADKVKEQARLYGHSQARELAFLVAHSMLHLCGYDHMEDQERAEMERRQEEILGLRGYRR